MRISLTFPSTWIDLLEPTNEDKSLGQERRVSGKGGGISTSERGWDSASCDIISKAKIDSHRAMMIMYDPPQGIQEIKAPLVKHKDPHEIKRYEDPSCNHKEYSSASLRIKYLG